MKKNPPCASWTEKWFLRLAKRSKQVKIVDCHSNDSIKMIFIMIVVMIFIMIFIMIFTMIFIAIIINIARSSPATEVSRRRSVRQWSYVRWPSLDSSFLLKMAQWRHHSLRPPSPSSTPQNDHSVLPVWNLKIREPKKWRPDNFDLKFKLKQGDQNNFPQKLPKKCWIKTFWPIRSQFRPFKFWWFIKTTVA